MKITSIIIRTEEAIGKKTKQAGSIVAKTYQRIPESVRTSAKNKTANAAQFICGNIIATALIAGGKLIAIPVYSIIEHSCRLLGCTESASEMSKIKNSLKKGLAPEGIKDAYKMFDVPKSGEFWSTDLRELAKKAFKGNRAIGNNSGRAINK